MKIRDKSPFDADEAAKQLRPANSRLGLDCVIDCQLVGGSTRRYRRVDRRVKGPLFDRPKYGNIAGTVIERLFQCECRSISRLHRLGRSAAEQMDEVFWKGTVRARTKNVESCSTMFSPLNSQVQPVMDKF